VAAATQKVIEPEMEAQETTLVSPRFDEAAEQRARPVVPLAAESLPASPISTINRVARPTPLLSKKVSWLLAALIGLILTVGAATAIGVNRYRRNQAAAASSPVPTAEPIRVELKPDSIPVESRPVESRPVASGPVEPKRSTAPSSVPAIAVAKPKKVEQRAQQPVSDGKPKARMVDSYNPR
jgi:hypothetical protein